ncbi:dihydrofolate reductase Ecym_2414 [Eremothecium cymbalariae DBVPG|uniref:Dihydrofolate reductase n=1 Tax=Eremothecium cymbalariae (strain CBS 270.75 / DBVPG 7215 / KCTC 17166 / NRRL Y-17582) TaxID=931890 RepID=G8JP88_ERECY|nr:Hypothetical protein Ecym_2414 [Eremothecium cymbalariae DBVPG\
MHHLKCRNQIQLSHRKTVMTAGKVQVVGIVACLIPEFGIGFRNQLPWKLPRELKYFRQVTTETFDPAKRNAVIMGSKTWNSIPSKLKPLRDRLNVVISRSFASEWDPQGEGGNCHVIHSNSLSGSIERMKEVAEHLKLERIYVIGGAEIYSQCYSLIDHLLITKIEQLNHDAGNRIQTDVFLDSKKIHELFLQDEEGPRLFVPPTVDLPAKQYSFTDNGLQVTFTLYDRK